ncbi:hypothetical protein COLO4_03784 [Corchorus olitorius]|uniref:Uncharacterized protein n=1 Tax=Corchorus olitorius TaxID=93759 RepID=A0A1R3KWR8_9ROSI|nr:hypothetical protein COLO4_03784 [Corchorus olitorius]
MSAHANPAICPNSSSALLFHLIPMEQEQRQKHSLKTSRCSVTIRYLMLHQQFSRKFQKNNFQSFSQ